MTGNDKCPVKPFKGTKLVYVPKNKLREYLYNSEVRANHPELILYIRSLYNASELAVIDQEIAEIASVETLSAIMRIPVPIIPTLRIRNRRPRNIRNRSTSLVTSISTPRDHSPLFQDERAIEL